MEDTLSMEDTLTFYQWMLENWTIYGGLIPQATAAKLMRITKGRITQMIKEGKLKELRYGNNIFVPYGKVMEYARAKNYKYMQEQSEKEIETLRGIIPDENINEFKAEIQETYEMFSSIVEDKIEID